MTSEPTARAVRYTGSFTLDAWQQQDDDASDGVRLSRAQVAKTFTGDLVGTSRTELLLAGADAGSQSYCGFEQFSGTVTGRAGSFVLRHAAHADATGAWQTWQVMPGTGSGELAAVRGEGQITRHDDGSHTYWLELTLD